MKIRRVPLSGGRPKRRATQPTQARFEPRSHAVRAGTSLAILVVGLLTSAIVPAMVGAAVTPPTAGITVPAGETASSTLTVNVPAVPPKADILIAIDTTGSMGPSIAVAKADATEIVTGVKSAVADSRFAIVDFRDSGDGTSEYVIRQAMTGTASAVQTAIDALTAGGGGDAPEAHNFVFRNSYTPDTGGDLGWRSGTKKIVVVISDAQPHGAGSATPDLPGCTDTSSDPHAPALTPPLNTATELAGMASSDRTLFMVLQASGSATLPCYSSIAGVTGGSAVLGGTGLGGTGLGAQIVALINGELNASVADLHLEVTSASPAPAASSWISFDPATRVSVTTPSDPTFDVDVSVPLGTPAGDYVFNLVALADGADIGHQTLTVTVPVSAQDPASITVNSTADTNDGSCTPADCTLREALNATNGHANGASPDHIAFALGAGVQTISPTSPLPAITDAVVIDGGASAVSPTCATGLVVAVNGTSAGSSANGIEAGAGSAGSTIRGLAITAFAGHGILASGSGALTVECDAITANGADGVSVTGSIAKVRINANSINGNGGLGIDLADDGVTANDTLDGDTGANGLQNAPIVVKAIAGAPGMIQGRVNSTPGAIITVSFYSSTACDPSGSGEGTTFIDATAVTTDAAGNAEFNLPATVVEGRIFTATATDSSGSTSEFSACATGSPDNDSWTRALLLANASDLNGYIDASGQARWFRFAITPGSQVRVNLSGLPADYDLALFKDIGAAFETLLTTDDLTRLSAEFAPSQFSPSQFSPSQFSPSQFSPEAYAPSQFSPSQFSPSMFSPSQFSPSQFSPSQFSPSQFSPSQFSPSQFSPSQFSPSQFSPSQFSPSQFSEAFTSAQVRSLIAVSATQGVADELVVSDTWNNTGQFYVRVAGRDGAFDPDSPFTVGRTTSAVSCVDVVPIGSAPTAVTGPTERTVIVWDSSRIAEGAIGDADVLETRLDTLAARPEVNGVVIDLAGNTRIEDLSDQADDHPACPYAKNLVADAIKDVVDSYRNSNLEYVVLVGGDGSIPFFRYADTALLGPESDYVPPVGPQTTSEASLRLNYVLSQDAYGAAVEISLRANSFPIPDLAVGRLVETASEATGMIDAYLSTSNGIVASSSSLVTGYDFLTDGAEAVEADLALGTGAPVDTLIEANTVAPEDSWNADDLRGKLSTRHDLVYLAGHFSANSALAADFKTSVLTTDLPSGTVLKNAIVFSAGCHSGYNIVDEDGIAGVTQPLDWTQAFAQKQATLIAGTGYQYGDTDFIEYSERIYGNFAHELRVGTGPVAVGDALVRAKQAYLRETPDIRGIHEKALLEATLFGLPMISVDMSGARDTSTAGGSEITSTSGYGVNPGSTLGLRSADLRINPATQVDTVNLTGVTGPDVTATYYTGPDGLASNPTEPVLPLDAVNVTSPTAGQVLRGVGFRGGVFSDSSVIPLTGAATTDLRGVHGVFSSPVFYPMRPWSTNYFDALGGGGDTRLLVTPAQHRSLGVTSNQSILRLFSQMDFRLFYSGNITSYGGNQPALAAPPSITDVEASVAGSTVTFRAHVVGDPSAGIQEVWITHTGWTQTWTSVDLSQDPNDSTLWTGTLPIPSGKAAPDLRFMAQAVNGVGLTSLDDNLGGYYRGPGATVAAPAATSLSIGGSMTGIYGDTAQVSATLTGTGSLTGKPVLFTLGGTSLVGTTNGGGVATVNLPLTPTPGGYALGATFPGDDAAATSSATNTFTITKLGTSLNLSGASSAVVGADSGVVATLREATTGQDPTADTILQRTVYFVVTGSPAGDAWSTTAITDPLGEAHLGPIPLPPGQYTVSAYFNGDFTLRPSNVALSLTDATYGSSTDADAFAIKGVSSIAINNIPASAANGGSFTPTYVSTGDGTKSTTSSTTSICTVGGGGLVTFIAAGTCTLTPSITAGTDYLAAIGAPQSFTVGKAGQTIAITSTAPTGAAIGVGTYVPTATSTSGLAVTFGASGACSIASGTVSFTSVGNCTVTANQAGDANFNAAPAATQVFAVKKGATLGYTGNLFMSAGSGTSANVTFTGRVTAASSPTVALTNARVDFLIFSSSNTTMTPDFTCSSGAATALGVVTCTRSLGLDNWTVIMRVPSGNAFFTAPDSDPVVLTVYQTTAKKYAVGNGWIVDPSFQNKPVAISPTNNHGPFGFAVSYKGNTTNPQGQMVYTFRGADGYNYVVRSTLWLGGGLSFGTGSASFSGRAMVIVTNPATGKLVRGLSGFAYTYRVDVKDGSPDKFAISVYAPGGALYHQAGTTASPISLGAGSIIVK